MAAVLTGFLVIYAYFGETLIYRAERPGFVRFTVIDDGGATDRTSVRFISD